MKLRYFLSAVLSAAVLSSQASAGEVETHQFAPVLENRHYSMRFDQVKLYFGDQSHPDGKALGEVMGQGKTNGFNKDGEAACQRTLADALIHLAVAAQKAGGDAVINIRSVSGATEKSSSTDYVCGAGGMVTRVELRGTAIKLP